MAGRHSSCLKIIPSNGGKWFVSLRLLSTLFPNLVACSATSDTQRLLKCYTDPGHACRECAPGNLDILRLHGHSGLLKWATPEKNAHRAPYQCVLAGVVNHPPLLHHCAAFPLRVFDRLHNSHERDVVACWWTWKVKIFQEINAFWKKSFFPV